MAKKETAPTVDETPAFDPDAAVGQLFDIAPAESAAPTVDELLMAPAVEPLDETPADPQPMPGEPSPLEVARAQATEAARLAEEANAAKAAAEAALAELEADAPPVDPGPHADAVHPPVVAANETVLDNREVHIPDFSLAIPDQAVAVRAETFEYAARHLSELVRFGGRVPFHHGSGVLHISMMLQALAANRGFVASYIPTPEGVPADGEIEVNATPAAEEPAAQSAALPVAA